MPFDGQWEIETKTPMGKQSSAITIETNDGTLQGVSVTNGAEQNFTGKIDGNHAEWALEVSQPFKMTLTFNVDIDGDAISGKVKTGMLGSFPLTGRRIG